MVDAMRIGERMTVGVFMVRHDNPKRTIEFKMTYCKDPSYNAKAYFLINFMNEMMKQGGCDYGIILPKFVKLSEDLEVFEVPREAVKITKLTESSKEFEDFVSSPRFTNQEKKDNFSNCVTAFCIFSYLFGGFNHDSGKPYTITARLYLHLPFWALQPGRVPQYSGLREKLSRGIRREGPVRHLRNLQDIGSLF